MQEIRIKTIPHKKHRYKGTVGDYWEKNGKIELRVSDLGNEYEELCVVIHELCEAFLVKRRGIKWKDIDAFDMMFSIVGVNEPGNDPASPYYKEHRFAENIERLLVAELGLDWFLYSSKVDKLN